MKGVKAFIIKHLLPYISMDTLEFIVNSKRSKNRYFQFNDTNLEYFFHSYNNFRLTERTIEIPIMCFYLKKFQSDEILEIGNVSSHYYDNFRELFRKPYDIVDKYEKGFNVINVDICNYKPEKKYDLIFSISTFEHMDEDIKGKKGIPNDLDYCIAIENMKYVINNLSKSGSFFILTIPIGQSKEIDHNYITGKFKEIACQSMNIYLFRRIGELEWLQLPSTGIPLEPKTRMDTAFKGVNSLLIIEIKTPDDCGRSTPTL
jgi:hypothetical protein